MLKPSNRKQAIHALVRLILQLDPFVDSCGRVYCELPHADPSNRAKVPMRDQKVRSTIVFRFRKKFRDFPFREHLVDALQFVEGKLLEKRQGQPVTSVDCPVLRCFLKAAEDDGGGSAAEILKLLRKVNSDHKLLRGSEKLPDSPTAMGKWLTRQQMHLLTHRIELDRPPRGSKKRLWSWQTIFPDGDRDARELAVSANASCLNSIPANDNRPDDTLTDEELQILKEAQS